MSNLRSKIIDSVPDIKKETVELFGHEIELRQPNLKTILGLKDEPNNAKRIADIIIRYAYDPKTGEPIFTPNDVETITEFPFWKDINNIQQAINRLTGLDELEAEREITEAPLDG